MIPLNFQFNFSLRFKFFEFLMIDVFVATCGFNGYF